MSQIPDMDYAQVQMINQLYARWCSSAWQADIKIFLGVVPRGMVQITATRQYDPDRLNVRYALEVETPQDYFPSAHVDANRLDRVVLFVLIRAVTGNGPSPVPPYDDM